MRLTSFVFKLCRLGTIDATLALAVVSLTLASEAAVAPSNGNARLASRQATLERASGVGLPTRSGECRGAAVGLEGEGNAGRMLESMSDEQGREGRMSETRRDDPMKWLVTQKVPQPSPEDEGGARAKTPRPQPPRVHPLLPADTRVERDLEYVAAGHARNKLDLYLPSKADRRLPVIVWIHGGAWWAGSKENCLATALVAKGYAVASINYRLSQHALFPAQIEDCKAAIRWLRANAERYGLDGRRIGVWGASAGGHLAALLGTSGDVRELEGQGGNLSQSSRVQCVVDFFGPTDVTQMGGRHDAHDSPEAKLLGGPVQQNKEKAARANPITYVSQDDPPFLIMHGEEDRVVPINQSELLDAALRRAGVPCTFVRIPKNGHGGPGFVSPESRAKIEEFFAKHLK